MIMMRPLVSVIIPMLNEEENLAALHGRLCNVANQFNRDVEWIFVDDGSTDASVAVLTRLRQIDPRIQIIKLSRNFGSHGACLAGFTYANGDHAVVLSADLQDPPEQIIELLRVADSGYDVVMGSREQRDEPALTIAASNIYNKVMRRIAMPNWPERGFDFMLVSRPVIDVLVAAPERNVSIFGRILWSGFRQTTISYNRGKRQAGHSKWTFGKKIKLAIDSAVAFSYLPIRLMSLVGLLCAALGLVYAMIVVGARLIYGTPTQGWASLMIVVLLLGGVQMVMLGVIGEYVWRGLDEIRRRPPFIVADRIGFQNKIERAQLAEEK